MAFSNNYVLAANFMCTVQVCKIEQFDSVMRQEQEDGFLYYRSERNTSLAMNYI